MSSLTALKPHLKNRDCLFVIVGADYIDTAIPRKESRAVLASVALSSALISQSVSGLGQMGLSALSSTIQEDPSLGKVTTDMERFGLLCGSSLSKRKDYPFREASLSFWCETGLQVGLLLGKSDMKRKTVNLEELQGHLMQLCDMVGARGALPSHVVWRNAPAHELNRLQGTTGLSDWLITAYMPTDEIWG